MEITLNGSKYQLWFNNYAVVELQNRFGVEQHEILGKVQERSKGNYLLLLSDLIDAGLKGFAYAKGELLPTVIDELSESVAVADMGELLKVWEVFFDIMGGNVAPEPKKKTKPKKQPQGKKS